MFAPHRDSHDSRYAEIGLIPMRAIKSLVWPLPDLPSLGLAGSLVTTSASAADLGVHGTVWPVTEANLIDRITSELSKAEEDGRLARFNGHVQDQLVSAYTRQPALALARVTRPSSRLFDPSLTVMRDIRDHRGILIAAAGTRINPLDRLPLPATLIFIDGRDPEQLAFALGHQGRAKIILTGGNPQQLMQMHDRQLFYDQKGVLSEKFQLKAVPTVITQQGNRLLISEIYVAGTSHGGGGQ